VALPIPQRSITPGCSSTACGALDAAAGLPECADRAIVTTGHSQGGGLALAVAQLHGGVAVTMPNVPFLAHYRRAIQITASHPYGEIREYGGVHSDRIEQVFRTLSYLDVVNHAKRCQAAALFSVALADDIAPASTVFGAFNHYAGPSGSRSIPSRTMKVVEPGNYSRNLTIFARLPARPPDSGRSVPSAPAVPGRAELCSRSSGQPAHNPSE